MKISKIRSVLFSPNNGTCQVVKIIANNIGDYQVECHNLTMPKQRNNKIEFSSDELLVIGFPVYADRLPTIADEIIDSLYGNKTPAVVCVSYGNRDYGDALLELANKVKQRGFKVIAATAGIAQHCLNTKIAVNRPDKVDKENLIAFSKGVHNKLLSLESIDDVQVLEIKGNTPYKPLKSQRTPYGDDRCIQCGLCFKYCPVNAIDPNDHRKTDSEICIFCGKCIQVCPTGARDMDEASFLDFMKKLEVMTKVRKEVENFI